MNFQELLTRLSASCFAADRPDYDWKTLRLFPETGLDLTLIARLAAALILCIVGALVHSTVLRYVLLVLSVLAAGYDYLAAAIVCILDRQVFRPSVIVVRYDQAVSLLFFHFLHSNSCSLSVSSRGKTQSGAGSSCAVSFSHRIKKDQLQSLAVGLGKSIPSRERDADNQTTHILCNCDLLSTHSK